MNESLLITAQEIMASVKFPSQPQIVVEIREEMNQPEPNFKIITACITKDLALTAKLLKIVNSPFFGLSNRVESARHALALLGLENFNNIVLASSMREALSNKNMTATQFDLFFNHSLQIAKFSKIVAQKMAIDEDDASSPSTAYLGGLFHDCGIPVLVQKYPDYFETMSNGLKADRPVEQIEEENYATNHSVVGTLVANSWKLPSHVRQVIYYHHVDDFSFLDDWPLKKMLVAVHLAESMAANLASQNGTGVDVYTPPVYSHETLAYLTQEGGVSLEELEEIEEQAEPVEP